MMPNDLSSRERSAADEMKRTRDFSEKAFSHLGAAEAFLRAEELEHAPAVFIGNQHRLTADARSALAWAREFR